MMGIAQTGGEQIASNLQKIIEAQTRIARRAVGAGVAVSVQSCREAAPGSTKNEVGGFVRAEGAVAVGRAGLMQFPKRGQVGKGPHAVYLTKGTKFIQPRHFIENALASSRPAANAAMERSIQRSIETVVS
jgi:hypothetical protein